MKILKRGILPQDKLKDKIFKQKCERCGCKFEFNFSDTYYKISVDGTLNHYVRCPQCRKSYFAFSY